MPVSLEELKRLYEADQRSGLIASHLGELPVSFEAIAPSWFTEILCKDYPDTEVIGFSLGPADDGAVNRRRIYLEYNENGRAAGLPGSVFCKATHDLNNRIQANVLGCDRNEVNFYNQARNFVGIDAPHAYFAAFNRPHCNSMIVFHDMCDATFCMSDTPITHPRACDMVDVLAKVHGRFYETPGRYDGRFDFPTFAEYWQRLIDLGFPEYAQAGFKAGEAVIPNRLFARFDEIWSATLRSAECHSKLPYSLGHGDSHIKNWFISREGRMGMHDWQGAGWHHWSRDLAYTLATSLAIEHRRAWERGLIERYLDSLERAGGKSPGFDKAWTCYRQQMLSSLSYWTVALCWSAPSSNTQTRPQSAHDAFEMVRRISTAVDDLDALDSFD